MNSRTSKNGVNSKRSCAYLHVLFEPLFCLTKHSNIEMVQNSEVMLGQTPNHSVQNPIILCNVISL
jgi:hypothetical protein